MSDEAPGGVPGWVICLTHTCSRWRAVALNHRPLWSMVSRHINLAWQQAFVDRSRNAPVELSMNLLAPDALPTSEIQRRTLIALDLVKNNLQRMKTLWLVFDSFDTYPDLTPILTSPAPMLRALQMNAVDEQEVELPLDLFQHNAPELISVDLSDIFFSWSCLAFPSLRMLKITQHLILDDSGFLPNHYDAFPGFQSPDSIMRIALHLRGRASGGA